jgi:hypothetical protein
MELDTSLTPDSLGKKITTYFHAVNCGDLVAAMAGFKEVYKKTGNKAVVYQQLNRAGNYYPGAVHPVRDEAGEMVTMNELMFDMVRPLIMSQEYIEDFKVWTGEKTIVNLDRIHGEVFINMPHGSINRWLFYAFPDMAADLSKAWIEIAPTVCSPKAHMAQDEVRGKILINRTHRYHNAKITYHFLRPMEDKCVFAGTQGEYKDFCKEWKLEMPRLDIDNFLELTQAMSACKLFLGNQSMCWNIAEAIKIPRVLEICPFAENCIPTGPDGYDCYYNGAMEYYVEEILGR